MIDAYCVKCREKGVKMESPAISQTAKGGFMAKGKCPKCSTTLCRIMSKATAEAAISSGEATKAS